MLGSVHSAFLRRHGPAWPCRVAPRKAKEVFKLVGPGFVQGEILGLC